MIEALARIRSSMRRRKPAADALSCANALLDLAQMQGRAMNVVRLQRLLVLAQGWHQALVGEPMFEEDVTILIDRPSVREVHAAFRAYGVRDIDGRARCAWSSSFDVPPTQDPVRLEVLQAVEKAYAHLDAWTLGTTLADMLPDPTARRLDPALLGQALAAASKTPVTPIDAVPALIAA
jgi:uncharacterized phage-associated protein